MYACKVALFKYCNMYVVYVWVVSCFNGDVTSQEIVCMGASGFSGNGTCVCT